MSKARLPSGNNPLGLVFIPYWHWGPFFWGWLWALCHRLWLWALVVVGLEIAAAVLLAPRVEAALVEVLRPLPRNPALAAAAQVVVLLVPYLGNLPLAVLGPRSAWKRRSFESMEQFIEVQRRWAFWGWWITIPIVVLAAGFTYIAVRDALG